MNLLKRRISILLCFIMVFTTVFVAAPTEAQAATTSYLFYGIANNDKDIVVYKGASNIYAGDFIEAEKYTSTSGYDYLGYLSTLSGVTYKSSKTSVATINSKTGKITAKKAGTTTITVKYKGNKITFDLTVMTKSKFFKKINDSYWFDIDYEKEYAKPYDKAAKAFLKATGEKISITKSNRYELLSAYKNYSNTYYNGYITVSENVSSGPSSEYSYYVFSPSTCHARVTCEKISTYSYAYNPFAASTGSAKQLDVKKITGSKKTVTVTLKKAITANQIYGANYAFSWDSEVKESKTYTFPIYVQDTKTGHKYYAIATMKQGSKTITIKLQNKSLKAGTTYKLLAQTRYNYNYSDMGGWLLDDINKNTFKAK